MPDNIQVVVRCRGRNSREVHAKSPIVVELPNDEYSSETPWITIGSTRLSALSGNSKQTPALGKQFKVDQVYGPNADQALVFENVALPLYHDFVSGLNVTMMAYGQTGSGKTYSMFGDVDGDESGIIPRILSRLFTSRTKDFLVKISCLELYNEELYDLNYDESAPGGTNAKPYLSAGKNSLPATVKNLNESVITTSKSGFVMLKRCLNRRKTSATKLNDKSSRSHTIVCISLWNQIESLSEKEEFCFSKMNLVDLAGSEDIGKSGASKERAREAGFINQSLLALGKVISLLSEGRTTHIPYRESKLTRILEDSLGGSTKTAFIATISPAEVNSKETISTLAYASKAKNIKNLPQSTQSHFIPKSVLVSELASQLERERKDRLDSMDKEGNVRISATLLKDLRETEQEHDTVVKEMSSKIAKLNAQLQSKISQTDSVQQKLDAETLAKENFQQKTMELSAKLQMRESDIEALNEELASAKHIAELKDSRISEIQEQINYLKKNANAKEQALYKDVSVIRVRTNELLTSLLDHISAGSSVLSNDIDTQKEKLAKIVRVYQEGITKVFSDHQSIFGPEWKEELDSQIQNGMDATLQFKDLHEYDISPELSGLNMLDDIAQRQIRDSLSSSAHEPLFKRAEQNSADYDKKILREIMPQIENVLRSLLNSRKEMSNKEMKQTFENLCTGVNEVSAKTFETVTESRKSYMSGIISKTTKHMQSVDRLERVFDEKKSTTATKVFDNVQARFNRGTQSLVDFNSQEAFGSVEQVRHCLDETKKNAQASFRILQSKIKRGRNDLSSPLTEINDTHTLQGSPRGKTFSSPVRSSHRSSNQLPGLSPNQSPIRPPVRSPPRFPIPITKRRKSSISTKIDQATHRSQIPLLQPNRKK